MLFAGRDNAAAAHKPTPSFVRPDAGGSMGCQGNDGESRVMQSVPAPGPADAVFERMRLYANALERTSPPVFVGRKDELGTLRAAVELVAGDNPRGMTHIVQGVPGAGKSSLCDEFLGAVQGTDVAGKVVLCAKMDPSVLDAPPLRLVAAVTEELRRTHAQLAGVRGLVAAGRRHAGLVFDAAGQLVFKTGEHRLHAQAHGLTDQSPLTTCVNAHADHMWPDNAVIVLAFDEMQECPVTDRTKAALRILNERLHGARILVTCFGLHNTETFMSEDLQLSRIPADAVMDIGPLNLGEGREVLTGTLDYFGVSADNGTWLRHLRAADFDPRSWAAWREGLVDVLDGQSQDFPQHLTAALRAFCLVLCAHRQVMPAGDVLRDAIADLHNGNKADYYRKRFGSVLGLHGTVLGGVSQATSEVPLPLPEVAAAFELGDDFGRPVDGERAAELAALATQRGVLTLADVGDELCYGPPPIPSMTQHLVARYTRKLDQGDPVALALAHRLERTPPR